MSTVFSCRDVRVRYGASTAIEGIDLDLPKGRMVGVLGANGAGKSTLANACAGWSRGPARVSGSFQLDGADITGLSASERARQGILLVPEGKNIFSTLTVEENILLVNRPRDTSGRFIFSTEQLYALFPRLAERRAHKGHQLSGGERQMLAIGCALLAGPKALLLDEPSIGLAPRLVVELLRSVRKLVDEGLAVLLVEQNAKAALEVVDRVMVLERGRVVMDGSAAEFVGNDKIAAAYLGGI